ncbi:MAG: hypothetical protein R2939_02525 [Kofleriaceae bacterium]
MRTALVLGVVLGCGRVGFEPTATATDDAPVGTADGRADAGASVDATCTLGPLAGPTPIAEVNLPGSVEWGAWISDDGLELLFGSDRAGGAGGSDLYQARRASTDVIFDPPVALTALNAAGNDDNPLVSADGLTIWFDRDLTLMTATRPSPDAAFGAPTVAGLTTVGDEYAIDLSADGLILVATSDRLGTTDLFLATRASTAAPFGVTTQLAGLNGPGFECCPTLSPDGQMLVYTSSSVGPSTNNLAQATRSGGTFVAPGAFEPVAPTLTGRDIDAYWARSGRFLVFSSDRDGSFDLYLLTASCP